MSGSPRATDHCPYCGSEVAVPASSHREWSAHSPRFLPRFSLPKAAENIRCAQCGQFLWFVVKPLDEVTVLTILPGMIVNGPNVGGAKELAAAADGVSRVVVDLSYFQVVPSFLLGTLIGVHLRLAKAGGKMKLCGLRPRFVLRSRSPIWIAYSTFATTNRRRVTSF